MKNLLLLTGLLLLSAGSFARAGQDKGNGGDACENTFTEVRDDIKLWFKNGGAKNLKLPKNVSSSAYLNKMGQQLESAKVSCTEGKLFVGKAEKTCKNFIDKGVSRIVCNSGLFLATDTEDQYKLVHHEYAGLAGFETNNGNENSNYIISNQLSKFLEEKTVKKLAVKIEATLESSTVKKFLAEANDPSTKLGTTILKINEDSIDGRNNDGIIKFPITKNDIKIIMINYIENYRPWNYGQPSEDKKTCLAYGNRARYIVALATTQVMHASYANETVNFTAEAEELFKLKPLDNSEVENCIRAGYEEDDGIRFGKGTMEHIVSPFKLITIPVEY